MNERDKLIEQLIQEEGGTREQYLSLMNKIAWHESAHTLDPTIQQQGGGPGRGKYQYEVGTNAGAITAARRTEQYYDSIGEKTPKWLKEATQGNSLDVSNLTSEQQDILFLGNMKMHPKADLAKVFTGEQEVKDFWANYHWAGPKSDKPKRLASFNDSLEVFDQEKPYMADAPKPQVQPTEKEFNSTVRAADLMASIKKRDRTGGITDTVRGELAANTPQPFGPQTQASDVVSQFTADDDFFSFAKARPDVNKELNSFNTGGSHQENPNGGIPIGMGSNGKMNTVEEGETKMGDFIFSDRIGLGNVLKTKQKK